MRRRWVVVFAAGAAALLGTGCAAPAGAGQVPAGAVGRAGAWRAAIEVPGTGGLNKGGNADVDSVSCASAGNCAAGGLLPMARGHMQGFVASETQRTLARGDRGTRPGGP